MAPNSQLHITGDTLTAVGVPYTITTTGVFAGNDAAAAAAAPPLPDASGLPFEFSRLVLFLVAQAVAVYGVCLVVTVAAVYGACLAGTAAASVWTIACRWLSPIKVAELDISKGAL